MIASICQARRTRVRATVAVLLILLGTLSPVGAIDGPPGGTPTVRFAQISVSQSESMISAWVEITLSQPSQDTVTVQFTSADGSATSPADYTQVSDTATFAPGQTSYWVFVAIANDGDNESSETFQVQLTNPTNAALDVPNSVATVTIVDDDLPPPPVTVQFGMYNYSVAEEGGTVTVDVTLSGVSASTVSVDWATADGMAVAGSDYTSTSGTLSFAPGETSKSIIITILDDIANETSESFSVSLSNPVNATVGMPGTTSVDIFDTDMPPPTVQFTMGSYMVLDTAGLANITVSLSSPYGADVTVSFATSDGSATSPDDYGSTSGLVTIPSGQTQGSFDVAIVPNTYGENDEMLNLWLSNPTNATLGMSYATLTIQDTTWAWPQVNWGALDYFTPEPAGTFNATLTLTSPASGPVTVTYAAIDGTAIAGPDYALVMNQVTFAAGEVVKNVPVTIVDDLDVEEDEDFQLEIVSVSGPAIAGSPPYANVTIEDNEVMPEFNFSDPIYIVYDTDGQAIVTVLLSAPFNGDLSVEYSTSDGTAIAETYSTPGDYQSASGTLNFIPHQTSATFTVTLWATVEPNAYFNVHLDNPQNPAAPGIAALTPNLGALIDAIVLILENLICEDENHFDLLARWKEAVKKPLGGQIRLGEVQKVYWHDASLHPTADNVFRKGHAEIRAYFTHLNKVKAKIIVTFDNGAVTHGQWHAGEKLAFHASNYTFAWGGGEADTKARYTFVYERRLALDGGFCWRILHHHSSAKPPPMGH